MSSSPKSAAVSPVATPVPATPAESVQKPARLSPDVQNFVRAQPGQVVIYISADDAGGADSLADVVGESGQVVSFGATQMLTDIADDSVDVIFSDSVYHKLVVSNIDRREWLADVHRVLKPDGTFIVADTNAGQGKGTSEAKSLGQIEDRFVLDEVSAAGFDIIEHGAPPGSVLDYQNEGGETAAAPPVQFMVKFRKPPVPPGFQEQ